MAYRHPGLVVLGQPATFLCKYSTKLKHIGKHNFVVTFRVTCLSHWLFISPRTKTANSTMQSAPHTFWDPNMWFVSCSMSEEETELLYILQFVIVARWSIIYILLSIIVYVHGQNLFSSNCYFSNRHRITHCETAW